MGENLLSVSDDLTLRGDTHPCPCSRTSTTSSTSLSAKPTSTRCAGKIAPSNVPGARARTSIRGGSTITAPDANATGATAASVPSMTSLTPSCTRASGRCHTGFWRPFCCVSPAHRGVLPESWGSISGPVIGGVGGSAMPRFPMRRSVSWRAPWKRMTSITPLGRRDKRNRAGRKHWDAVRVGAVRSASPAGGIMTKTGPPLSPGSAARELS